MPLAETLKKNMWKKLKKDESHCRRKRYNLLIILATKITATLNRTELKLFRLPQRQSRADGK